MYPPLKLEMGMLICCFALLTGWAGLVHVWIVTAQGNGKVLVLGMDGLFTTHLLAVVACQATRRMTEDELPGPLAEGAGLFVIGRGARGQKRRQTTRRGREEEQESKEEEGSARMAMRDQRRLVGRTCLVLLPVLAGTMLDAGPPGGKGEPLGRMEVSGAAPDWALVRELASISLLPHGVDDADWARPARAWGRFVVDMDWPVDAIASGWG